MIAIEFKDLIKAALSDCNEVIDCDFTVEVDGRTCEVYEASVSYRDILLFAEQGTVTYLVDSFGDRHTAELFDWSFDQD